MRETGATVSTHTFFVAQHGRRHGAGVEAVIVGGHEGRRRTSGTGGYKLGGTGDPEEWIQVGGFSLPLLWVAAYILGRDAESVGSRGV